MIIDFHAHILPGLDHGCKDLQTSIYQLKMAKSVGVDVIVATPHFYPHIDTVNEFLIKRQAAWEMLRGVLSSDLPQVMLGTEILVCQGLENMTGIMDLGVVSSGTMLLELPNSQWNAGIIDTIVNINAQSRGKAVLAHVDRYDKNYIEALFELGFKGQINVDNLCKRRNSYLWSWVNKDKIVALGSDIHGKSRVHKKFCRANSLLGAKFSELMHNSDCLLFNKVTNER